MTFTIVFCAVAWVLGWWAFGRVRRLGDLPAERPRSTVTIVVPARDEELSLPVLLEDLRRHRPPGAQVVVVDDHSTDRTRAIAAAHDFVQVVDAPDLPEGWTGKSWACHTGASHATGDVLVFLDADVRLGAGSIDRLVSELERRGGGLVSVQPWHVTERPYEQLSALFNIIAVMGTGAGGRGEPTGAFGPVMATTVEDYRLVGGHASVCDEVVEDLALAARYRSTGFGVEILTGRGAVSFRMYPAGLGQVVEGWTKNFASGAGATGATRLAAAVVWVTGLGTGAVALADGVRGILPLALGLSLYGVFVAQVLALSRQVGRFGPLTAVAYPVLVLFFFAVFARSLWNTRVRRTVQWRGRDVRVGAAKG